MHEAFKLRSRRPRALAPSGATHLLGLPLPGVLRVPVCRVGDAESLQNGTVAVALVAQKGSHANGASGGHGEAMARADSEHE